MIDWGLYLNTGRCAAQAIEDVVHEAGWEGLLKGQQVVQLPPGTLTLRRPVELSPATKVILHAPSTYIKLDYYKAQFPEAMALERKPVH